MPRFRLRAPKREPGRSGSGAGTDSPMLAAALAGAARGWSVLPVRPRAKVPLLPWMKLQERRADEHEIRAWFERWPDANVGVVTGKVSGLLVLDVDPGHGGGGSLAALEAEHGPLPDTVESITGGGGRHCYFAHPGGAVPNRVAVLPGLDVRGDGGTIVMPPSMHPSGRRYRWAPGRSPTELDPAPLPQWLAHLLRGRPQAGGHTPAHWRGLLRDGVAQGARNDTIASLAGYLLWHGVDPFVVLQLVLCWNGARCRPPLGDEEVARTVASIVRMDARAEGGPRAP